MAANVSNPGALQNFNDLQALQSLKQEPDRDKALRQVAQEFESIFINMMLKSMRQANEAFEDGNLFGGEEAGMYRDMYDQQLSLAMAHGRGIGIADAMYAQMSDQYGQGKNGSDLAAQMNGSLDPRRRLSSPAVRPTEAALSPQTAPPANAGGEATPQVFIDRVLPIARQVAGRIGLDPLVMVAQAALETGWGKFVTKDAEGNSSNNLFNIKADSSWSGERVEVRTREYREGRPVEEKAAFRRYESLQQSAADFVDFVQRNPRYQEALKVAGDAPAFVQALQEAGYATDPRYAQKVLSVLSGVNEMLSSGVSASAGP